MSLEKVMSYNDLLNEINTKDKLILYVMSENCSVCHADFPKVNALAETYNVDSINIMINEIPEAVGQLSLFTSPVVILFYKNKEMHRQARIIDFEDLEYRIKQLNEIED